jgi:hypothetical protein
MGDRQGVIAMAVEVSDEQLRVVLDDGRTIETPLNSFPWLQWLRTATDDQRANWSLEPGGFAIYWPELDDGVEVRHLLSLVPLR